MNEQSESNKENSDVEERTEEHQVIEPKKLPSEAIEHGFTDYNDWENAKTAGFDNYEDWEKAKKGKFDNYNDWLDATNEGFDTSQDWDDWNSIKESGFSDIDLFYESKNIGFYQNSLRKAFLSNLKLAKKGGFNSFQMWKNAQKWNVDDFEEWSLVQEMNLQTKEEYELVKEFQNKIVGLLDELYINQEISITRIVEIFAEDYKYDFKLTDNTAKVYKNFTRLKFETLLARTIKQIANDSEVYKYSRLNNSILKVAKEKFTTSTQKLEIKSTNEIKCPNCQNKIAKTSSFCPECGEKIEKCPICQSALFTGIIGSCPHCNNGFHLNHIQEVIKVSGQCPICKHELKEFEILE